MAHISTDYNDLEKYRKPEFFTLVFEYGFTGTII